MKLTEVVSAFVETHNCIAGICSPLPLDKQWLEGKFTPFVSQDIEKRTNPAKLLNNVKSIIVLGVPQNLEAWRENKIQAHSDNRKPPIEIEHVNYAELSSLGIDNDYHIRVKELLKMLVSELNTSTESPFKYKILVDSSSLDERMLAHRAGLGFFGRNGLIISEKFGSRFNIGLLLTEIPLCDNYVEIKYNSKCQPDCKICVSSCPTGALEEYNAEHCISYLTQKEVLTYEEKQLLSNQLYGCDICQNVCPFNSPRSPVKIDPAEWLNMSDIEFMERYKHTAMLWRGIDILRRNASTIMQNNTRIEPSQNVNAILEDNTASIDLSFN